MNNILTPKFAFTRGIAWLRFGIGWLMLAFALLLVPFVIATYSADGQELYAAELFEARMYLSLLFAIFLPLGLFLIKAFRVIRVRDGKISTAYEYNWKRNK